MPVLSILCRFVSWVVASSSVSVSVSVTVAVVSSRSCVERWVRLARLASLSRASVSVLFTFPIISFVARRVSCFGHESCDAGL